MKVHLEQVGKKFNREWIFRNINLTIDQPTAILGGNGSGKSTLLQIISGFLTPSEGAVNYTGHPSLTSKEEVYKHVSIATPYLELPEEMNLCELLQFHRKFKPFSTSTEEVISYSGLGTSRNKQIRYYSSGMKQRVKLTLAFFSDTPLLLLDEPLSNLDEAGKEWYRRMIDEHCSQKLIIVASNHYKEEYFFCSNSIDINSYKATASAAAQRSMI